jgi:hypothetical protein
MHVPSTLTFCLFLHSFYVLFIILISWCADKSMHCLCFPVLKLEMKAFSPLLMLKHNKICKCVTWMRDESNIYKVACRFPWLSQHLQVPKLGRFREVNEGFRVVQHKGKQQHSLSWNFACKQCFLQYLLVIETKNNCPVFFCLPCTKMEADDLVVSLDW